MKKIILSLLPIFACCSNQQQSEDLNVAAAVEQLMNEFVTLDKAKFEAVLADDLVYIHSNGRAQNKTEFMAEILDKDPLTFLSVELLNQTIKIFGDIAVVQHIFTAETMTTVGNEPGSIHIGVMQVWQQQKGAWKLVARQGQRL